MKVKEGKLIFKVKYDFSNIARKKCNTSFCVFLTGKSIIDIIFIIQGHLESQNVNFKIKNDLKIYRYRQGRYLFFRVLFAV